MPTSKVHPKIRDHKQLHNGSRILILGPLEINSAELKKSVAQIDPNLIILVDGGSRHKHLLAKSLHKKIKTVGDGDSSLLSMDLLLPVIKDFSDLAYVLRTLTKAKVKIEKLALFGFSSHFLDNRLDHLLFNLSEVEKITGKLKIPIRLDERFLFLPPGKNTVRCQGLFSVMSFSGTNLKLVGKCKYQLKDWTRLPRLSTLGLSNSGSGLIHLECKKPLLLYLAGINLSS